MDAKVETNANGQRIVTDPCLTPCPIEAGMRVLGGKWTGSLLWHLRDGPVRFNDLARMVGGASKKMVTERLRHLEAHGLITRTVRPTAPVSVVYEITEYGRTALSVLEALKAWSEDHPAQSSVPG